MRYVEGKPGPGGLQTARIIFPLFWGTKFPAQKKDGLAEGSGSSCGPAVTTTGQGAPPTLSLCALVHKLEVIAESAL